MSTARRCTEALRLSTNSEPMCSRDSTKPTGPTAQGAIDQMDDNDRHAGPEGHGQQVPGQTIDELLTVGIMAVTKNIHGFMHP